MIDWIFTTFPIIKANALIIGTLLIILTSILFLIKIETVSDSLQSNEKHLAGDSENLLTQLLLPLCTALPNFIFAFSALKNQKTAYLVVTSNIGNNVTNITLFAGLILLIGFIKKESFTREDSISLRKDFNFLAISTIIFFVCIWDEKLTRNEGVILAVSFFYSMTSIFTFQLKDLYLIFTIISKLAFFFALAGFFIYIGSELIIYELESIAKNGSSGLYEVLLPGFVLVIPSVLPLLLTITKPNMQKIALSGIIGDSLFSIPLIVGLMACFTEEISLKENSHLFRYLLISTIIAFVSFNFILPTMKKSKVSFWMVLFPFIAYVAIVFLSAKGI